MEKTVKQLLFFLKFFLNCMRRMEAIALRFDEKRERGKGHFDYKYINLQGENVYEAGHDCNS